MKSIYLIENDSDDREIFELVVKEIAPDTEINILPSADDLSPLIEHNPEVVFLTIEMPSSELLPIIDKVKPLISDVPIVIITSVVNEKALNYYWEKGVGVVIKKPDTMNALRKLMETIIKQPEILYQRTRDKFYLNNLLGL